MWAQPCKYNEPERLCLQAATGSDVYVMGYAGQTAAYWVNDGEGTLLPIPSGSYKSWANAIAVSTQ
jgi:hypothetical protein